MIIATNIRVTKEQWQALKMKALLEGTSASALVRTAIDQLVQSDASVRNQSKAALPVKKEKKKKTDPFVSAIGLGSGGPSNDSIDHDHYLYQRK